MKRQKTSEATMSWFESIRGSQLNDNDLQIDRRIDDFLACHFPAAFSANPCSLLALLWRKVLEDESVALTLTGL
jgi:hypothetical protein